ncbi:TRAP transporter large permease [Nesterenkonia sphaerica]|uniref:TRAP transporter large permease n=1 Tax=Nesterenkonia sphaerica TaxID=1804988 RepID=A0A5R9AG98_9MICC|nr:TRAP transporter large permease [Nesterenkonia sphaerica]TLP77520.1 TRAP transporter large permease [Nesterenkonia sphaerica]
MSLTLLVIFVILFLLGVPLAVSLGVGVIGTMLIYDIPLNLLPQMMLSSMNSFLLVAVPLFVLAGSVMAGGGISDRIFSAAQVLFGRYRGGLGHVNIVASAVFGGISGSSVADVVSLGKIEIKAMTDRKYPRAYAAATTMATSTLSSVIPPSILIIIAASTAGVSVGAALAGGLGPAAVLIVVLMVVNYIVSVRKNYGEVTRTRFKRGLGVVLASIPALGGPVVILVGMFGGAFTPTEAAAIAVFYSLLVGAFVYRDMKWRDMPKMIVDAGLTSGTILFIAMVANVATYIFTIDGLPARVSDWVLSMTTSPIIVMLLMGLILVFIGTVMDIVAAILLTIPVLMPAALAAGVDPIHFVVFLVASLSIGLVTPPVGVALFATSYVSKLPMEVIVRAAVPHYTVMFVALAILAVFPELITWPAELLTDR